VAASKQGTAGAGERAAECTYKALQVAHVFVWVELRSGERFLLEPQSGGTRVEAVKHSAVSDSSSTFCTEQRERLFRCARGWLRRLRCGSGLQHRVLHNAFCEGPSAGLDQ
jgi:hypothetical protein